MSNPLAAELDHVLTHTQGVWDDLRGARLFITGGTGFFGTWLLESFAWANDRLGLDARATVLSRNPDRFKVKAPHLAEHKAIEFAAGDVTEFGFPAGPFSHVIHAATDSATSLNDEDPLCMIDTIVNGTRRVLEFARVSGARKFLLTSSGAVYGRQPSDLSHIPEDFPGAPDPANPRSAYGEGKRMAELLCTIYAERHGIDAKIARCFAFVGPHLPIDAHFAVGNFVRDALRGGPISVIGDGTPYRSYLYAADLAVWLWTILCKGVPRRAYNVGSDAALSIRSLAGTVSNAAGGAIHVTIAGQPVPGQPASRYVPAIGRAAADLGLAVHIPLLEALRRMIRWHVSRFHNSR
jgi:dTDP-glucose 4,6-dehydratase